jgi:hypothetical protein
MKHPDLPDNDPIEVADSAAPQHRGGGWFDVDPPQKPKADAAGDKTPRATSVRMRHPEVDDEITVAQSAVPFHTASGWSVIEDTPNEQAAAGKPDGNKTKGGRQQASAAKKKEGQG